MANITGLPNVRFQVTPEIDIFHTAEKAAKYKTLRKVVQVAWDILSVIVFPIGLVRLAGALIRNITKQILLPAQYMFDVNKPENAPKVEELDQKRQQFLANANNRASQVTIETADSVKLDNVVIRNLRPNEAAAEQKWIIYFGGNGACYENMLEDMKRLSDQTGANVLVGNPRGVFRSEGNARSSKDLILDGEAKIQYLKNLGVDTKNIFLHGHSLGGGIATAVAVNHQDEGHEVSLCNDRSFASTQAVVKAWMGKLAVILNPLAINGRWDLNSAKNYKKINGHKFIIHTKDDQVIHYASSLYKHLKDGAMTKADRKLKAERKKAAAPGQKSIKQEGVHTDHYKPTNVLKMEFTKAGEDQDLQTFFKQQKGFAHCVSWLNCESWLNSLADVIPNEEAINPLLDRVERLTIDYSANVWQALQM